ncbi:hypothetical protein NPIL_535281 [Nephila pilipes]|uniref:Uncharacterized protein n=1 Tax=Nephila pilipes TaxID=299642 RepID=A0A8X6PF03_NEPPI|nr:hypothetical protein NPIL_535281 [Nephila pilipes]
MDDMTTFIVIKAIPIAEAIVVANFIVEEIALKHGAPREMIRDKERLFLSNIAERLTKEGGVGLFGGAAATTGSRMLTSTSGFSSIVMVSVA